MRSQQRDRNKTVTFSALFYDAPSGVGVAQSGVDGGIAFSYVREATGTYRFRFDSRIVPVSVAANPHAQAAHSSSIILDGPGTFRVINVAAGNAVNWHGYWSCTAIDKRT